MDQIPETLVDLLLTPGGGRVAAGNRLAWLLAYFSARSASLWEVEDSTPALRLSSSLDAAGISATLKAWREARWVLETGTPWTSEATLVVPAPVDGVVYLVTLDGLADPEGVDKETVSSYARVAAKAFRHGGGHEVPARDINDVKREELIALLNREEWNLARVARLSRISRQTLYKRLARLSIPRERVYRSIR